jgi:hypothetical protein
MAVSNIGNSSQSFQSSKIVTTEKITTENVEAEAFLNDDSVKVKTGPKSALQIASQSMEEASFLKGQMEKKDVRKRKLEQPNKQRSNSNADVDPTGKAVKDDIKSNIFSDNKLEDLFEQVGERNYEPGKNRQNGIRKQLALMHPNKSVQYMLIREAKNHLKNNKLAKTSDSKENDEIEGFINDLSILESEFIGDQDNSEGGYRSDFMLSEYALSEFAQSKEGATQASNFYKNNLPDFSGISEAYTNIFKSSPDTFADSIKNLINEIDSILSTASSDMSMVALKVLNDDRFILNTMLQTLDHLTSFTDKLATKHDTKMVNNPHIIMGAIMDLHSPKLMAVSSTKRIAKSLKTKSVNVEQMVFNEMRSTIRGFHSKLYTTNSEQPKIIKAITKIATERDE